MDGTVVRGVVLCVVGRVVADGVLAWLVVLGWLVVLLVVVWRLVVVGRLVVLTGCEACISQINLILVKPVQRKSLQRELLLISAQSSPLQYLLLGSPRFQLEY